VPAGGLKFVTNLPRLGSPNRAVTGIFSNQCVGNFMKDNLLYLLDVAIFDQVSTNGNSASSEVTLACSIDRPVETKGVIDQPMSNKELMRQINGLDVS
jgi:hypothetical protein